MKVYQVSPEEKNKITIGVFEKTKNTLKTNSRSEALKFANTLSKKYNSITFNCDTYKKGLCVKNEFGRFTLKGIEVYEVVNYETKKIKIDFNISDYFGSDVLNAI